MIQTFRKKPVVIQAIKWDGKAETLSEIVSFVLPRKAIMPLTDGQYDNPNLKAATLYIETLEGVHECSVGDMIIKGVAGECYPCKPDIFEKTYEPAISRVSANG